MASMTASARKSWASAWCHRPAAAMMLRRALTTRLLQAVAVVAALAACTELPSWQKLLTARITQQYPAYTVQPAPDGSVIVRRPGLADVPVDVNAIALFCRRGPKDCDYATEQMLLELGAPEK